MSQTKTQSQKLSRKQFNSSDRIAYPIESDYIIRHFNFRMLFLIGLWCNMLNFRKLCDRVKTTPNKSKNKNKIPRFPQISKQGHDEG